MEDQTKERKDGFGKIETGETGVGGRMDLEKQRESGGKEDGISPVAGKSPNNLHAVTVAGESRAGGNSEALFRMLLMLHGIDQSCYVQQPGAIAFPRFLFNQPPKRKLNPDLLYMLYN